MEKKDMPSLPDVAAGDRSEPVHSDTPEGPAPVKSLPPSLIQEEYSPQPNASVAEKVPRIVEEGNNRRVTPLNLLTKEPAWIDCPFCKRTSKTQCTTTGSNMQTVAGVLLCLFCICLACVPCMCGWCEKTTIFCASCGNKVATIPEDGQIQVVPAPPQV
ncbi:hypothetical protein F5X96DRAFT_642342 [Biscogniauxia mediterranea]|nr:hypothetical protein F5X96DRAFT_642342 [Biscogniauxia mediterranea]